MRELVGHRRILMASQLRIGESTRRPTDEPPLNGVEDDDDDETEIEKLEEEILQMAEKVEDYRSTLPNNLKSTLSSLLASQRPRLTLSSDVSTSGHHAPGTEPASGSSSRVLATGDDENIADQIKLLRHKISSNISASRNVLKRMNDCLTIADKVDSSNETIHPAFKRKKS